MLRYLKEVNFLKSFRLKLRMHFLLPSLALRVTPTPCSLIFTLSVCICPYVIPLFLYSLFLIYLFIYFAFHIFSSFFHHILVFLLLGFANRHYNRTSHKRLSLEGFVTNHKAHINKQPLHYQEGAYNHPQRNVILESSSH